jgi:hypothetical protein
MLDRKPLILVDEAFGWYGGTFLRILVVRQND